MEHIVPLSVRGEYIIIPLGDGLFAKIDLECWPIIGRHKWHTKKSGNTWYAATTIGRGMKMHQLVMGLRQGYVPDHINRDGLDNRRVNLRWATRQMNCVNAVKRRPSNTGYRGAYFDNHGKRFTAKIIKEGKIKYLGRFPNAVEAAKAYDRAAREIYGEFAITNFPTPCPTGVEQKGEHGTATSD